MTEKDGDLVFVPLGGLGEIGMNMSLYGFGPPRARKWLMVDCGVAFAGPELAGIDLIVPDTSFIEKMRADLVGIIITHAHEDHIGAVADLWSRLKAPVYATRFAAGLLETKRLNEYGAPKLPIRVVQQGATIDLAPFSVEFIPVAHSVPESCALAIRTPVGTVVHTGDWKIDERPGLNRGTDVERLTAIGKEGVLALVCDSTNILREGVSPSEAEVAATLEDIIRHAKGRVLVTTFASNLARMRAVAEAATRVGRQVVLVGRSVNRIINNLIRLGVEVITDRNALIHASGHPRRGEVAQMYDWIKPKVAIPVHGEEVHLAEHYDFARERQVPHVVKARNGDVVVLGPGEPGIVDQVAHGRLFKDGNLLIKADDESLRQRQSLAFGGVVTIALAVTAKGEMVGTPDVVTNGLPARTRDGEAMDALVDATMFQTFDNLPKQRRRDADTVSTAIERAVRSAVNQAWGKRPAVHVLVVEVG